MRFGFFDQVPILADPLMVLAAAAQRTRRIRLGTAVTLLPLREGPAEVELSKPRGIEAEVIAEFA